MCYPTALSGPEEVPVSWLYSILAAVFCIPLGLFGAGWIASVSVRWFHISSREGQSGYYVILLALLGGVGAAIFGAIAAAVAGRIQGPSFLIQTSVAIGVVTILLLIYLGTVRFFADIPPTWQGESLELEMEIRLPEAVREIPEIAPEALSIEIGAIQTLRRVGGWDSAVPIDLAGARFEEGRVVVPARVPLTTATRKRIAAITIGTTRETFLLPIAGRPRPSENWSIWLPRNPPPGVAVHFTLTYRFRVRTEIPSKS